MKRVIVLVLVVAVVAVGATVGWRFVLAPLLGLLIWAWARATLKSFARPPEPDAPDEPRPVGADERTLYWCEECGTEYLLVVRGSGAPPRHCGTRMHERTEVLN